MDIHAVAPGTPQRVGCCCWSVAFEDVLLRCFAVHFPFEPDCVDHYIARVHSTPDPDVRRFGPVTVTIPEVQA